jgi:pimeloyl-ACP methyl ester carboxylesterase
MDNLSSWYFTLGNQASRLAQVLLLDLRGHGRSERPPSGYRVCDMVADLAAVLEAQGVAGPVHIVGNSFGGLLALAFAMAYPRKVASLLLVDAQLSDDKWVEEMTTTLGLQDVERDREIARHFGSWLGRHSSRKRNRLAATARALVYETSLVNDLKASRVFDDSKLALIGCPVLALYGAESDGRHRGERLARLLPDCRIHFFPSCTHSVLWEATQEVCERGLDWLARQIENASGAG